jgi:hypothetical protein
VTAIYPSKGPLLEVKGFPTTVFRHLSNAGSRAFANSNAFPVLKSTSASKKTRPAKETNALLTGGLVLLISFTIKAAALVDIGTSAFKRKVRCGGKADASTATAASCVSFASKDVVESIIDVETLEDGVRKDNIEYNATRWSGPADLPVFGRLSSSATDEESRSSDSV